MRTPVALFLVCLLLCACYAPDDAAHTDVSKIASVLPPSKVETSTKACSPDTAAENANDVLRLRVLEIKSGGSAVGVDVETDGSDVEPRITDEATYRWSQGDLPRSGSINISCRAANPFDFYQPYVAKLPYILDGCKELTARIDLSRCNATTERTRKVRLRGMYISGFEESSFFPCDGLLPEASEFRGSPHKIWLEATASMSTSLIRASVASLFSNHRGITVLFADMGGELHGPGPYGHMGGSAYEFRAHRTYETSIWKPKDCKAPGFAERMAYYE